VVSPSHTSTERYSELLRLVVHRPCFLPAGLRKGANSLVSLVAWSIWKHRNAIIFDGLVPSPAALSQPVF